MDKGKRIVPVSAVIATRNRADILRKTLASIAAQSFQPKEIIVADASDSLDTQHVADEGAAAGLAIRYFKTLQRGAAVQRMEGIERAGCDVIWFADDDIILEEDCIQCLWLAITSDERIGGINAMITNQRYHSPGFLSRTIYRLMNGKKLDSYAGRCIGPAVNLLPEDSDRRADVVDVDWLNTTCTFYRRAALPDPVFDPHFKGYSLMEDLALSLRVKERWRICNARTARIFHDSQQGDHKRNLSHVAEMELVNRVYIMKTILGKSSASDFLKLFLFESFQLASVLASPKTRGNALAIMKGKLNALRKL